MNSSALASTIPGIRRDPLADYFDRAVPADGYRWWYADVVSDCGTISIVIIGFIGSVFSPYYASARRHAPADPNNHVAFNAIVYRPGRKHWAMTERSTKALATLPAGIRIGPSSMCWDDGSLLITVDERCNPLPTPWRGTLRLTPAAPQTHAFALHSNERHWWWPVAPQARAEVEMQSPALSFTGSGYIDTNWGSEPLEAGFRRWDWTRAEHLPDSPDEPVLTYRTVQRDGQRRNLALGWSHADGALTVGTAGPEQVLAKSGWRVARRTALNAPVTGVRTLEDTPFYARSLLHCGQAAFMHESLDLDRFASHWVQQLLPFRMPRHDTRRGTP